MILLLLLLCLSVNFLRYIPTLYLNMVTKIDNMWQIVEIIFYRSRRVSDFENYSAVGVYPFFPQNIYPWNRSKKLKKVFVWHNPVDNNSVIQGSQVAGTAWLIAVCPVFWQIISHSNAFCPSRCLFKFPLVGWWRVQINVIYFLWIFHVCAVTPIRQNNKCYQKT